MSREDDENRSKVRSERGAIPSPSQLKRLGSLEYNVGDLSDQTALYLEGAKSRAMRNGIVLTDQLLIELILATLSR